MLDGLKRWNDRTRARNQVRAARMNGWMDTHGPNAWGDTAAAARAVDPDAIASFAGLHLYPDHISARPTVSHLSTPHDDQPIVGVTATVDTDGSVAARGTLTRSVLVGGWQKEVDTRQAWIVVDGPAFQWVVPIGPGEAVQARQFAAQVTAAGRRAQG